MKLHRFGRKAAVLGIFLGAVAISGVAFAYFTSGGSGSGSATVGSTSAVQISNDTPAGQLYPGGSAVSVSVHLHNPGSGNEYIGTVSGSVEDNGSCLGSWFTVAPKAYNAEVNAGATNDTTTTISMSDSGGNQDACQGKTLTIDWSSN
jgi:hypothetical protein